jgi:hypothetical protein
MLRKTIIIAFFAISTCVAQAATSYTLTFQAPVNSAYDYDAESSGISTSYGMISAGSTITLSLVYDISDLTQLSTVAWGGGSGVQYSSANAAVATIGFSSGYNFSGAVTPSGASNEAMSFYDQTTLHDQINFNDLSGNIFMQFNDFTSATYNSQPIYGESVSSLHSTFVSAVNSGLMKTGGPSYYALPGIGSFRDVNLNFGTPTLVNISATAVPEPSAMMLLGLGLVPLLRRKRVG